MCPGATNSSAEYNKDMFLAVDGVAGKAFPRIDNNDTLAALTHALKSFKVQPSPLLLCAANQTAVADTLGLLVFGSTAA